jgi:ubiquinone/menaquinone biosynthesis C-methylase UbiE
MVKRETFERKRRQLDFYRTVAPSWEEWAEAIAPDAESCNLPLLEAAALAPAERVLDLASGAGEPALAAARAVGDSGHVTATDLSPEMLGIVERRARAAGLGNISFRVADMEQLPFEDRSFDRVVCRFGVMHSPEPANTFAEARRVLKPGARAAFMVWGEPDHNTLLTQVVHAANAVLRLFTEEEQRQAFCFAEKGSMSPLLREAGFQDAEERDFRLQTKTQMGVPFWIPVLGCHFGTVIAKLGEEGRSALYFAIAETCKPSIVNGGYQLDTHVRIGVGTAP